MKRQFNVTIEVRKKVTVPVIASDEVEAEALAEQEVWECWDEDYDYAEWFVYDVQEVEL